LKEVANQRQHRETGEKPHRCFQPESLHLSKPYYCASGKVNSADKLYLVIESVKPDHKHGIASNAPAGADRGEVVLGADPGCGE
jgi:hypothetical protein